MTIAASFWPRRFNRLPAAEDLLVSVDAETRILARCHWRPEPGRHPAVVLVHGLEGSCESGYVLGTAERAWEAGFSVIRMNQRNCGGTERLTPTLYNSGLSCDVRAVVETAIKNQGVRELFVAGFSLGGNLALKMAGEFAEDAPEQLTALAAVSPAIDLAACAAALEIPRNWIYERHFLRRLKQRIKRKARLFPERYPLSELESIGTIREFDDRITAPHSGFRDASDYYYRASALRAIEKVSRPVLILAAQDDPLVPIETLDRPEIRRQPHLRLVTPRHGGHCGFISSGRHGRRFWAEAVVVEFFRRHSQSLGAECGDR